MAALPRAAAAAASVDRVVQQAGAARARRRWLTLAACGRRQSWRTCASQCCSRKPTAACAGSWTRCGTCPPSCLRLLPGRSVRRPREHCQPASTIVPGATPLALAEGNGACPSKSPGPRLHLSCTAAVQHLRLLALLRLTTSAAAGLCQIQLHRLQCHSAQAARQQSHLRTSSTAWRWAPLRTSAAPCT